MHQLDCHIFVYYQLAIRHLQLLAQLRAHFPNYLIMKIRLDNVGEFTSHAFQEYCISIEIEVEHQ